MTDETRPTQSRGLTVTVAFAILLAGVVTVGWRWYRYVTAGPTLYNEVGIEVNRLLPKALRTWGCERIKERSPCSVPLCGC